MAVAFCSLGPGEVRRRQVRRSWGTSAPALVFSLSGFCISFGSFEPLDILALFERANPGRMPTATRQQADDEERAATAAALGAAQGQAEQVAAAEQAAKEALELERIAREEAEKAREALEERLAELEASEASASEVAGGAMVVRR